MQSVVDGGFPLVKDDNSGSQFLLVQLVENGYRDIYFYQINESDILQAVHCLTISPEGKYSYSVQL